MNEEVRYKLDQQTLGPVAWEEVRRNIVSGMLPANTPVQLVSDGLWSDLPGIDAKLAQGRHAARALLLTTKFLILNAASAGLGYRWIFVPLLCAAILYPLGLVANYFDEGRTRPEAALAKFLTMLFPFCHVHYVNDWTPTPFVRWSLWSAFGQFALFCLYVGLLVAH